MKHLYSLLFLFAFSPALFAQNDPHAKVILDKLNTTLKNAGGITAGFVYSTKDKKGVKRGSVNGSISVKGDMYYLKNGSTEIYSNGKQVWNYNPENKEVTVSAVDNDSKTLSPQKLLSADVYEKDFTYQLGAPTAAYNKIVLVPNDKRKNFKQVLLYIGKATNMVAKAEVLDRNDNTIEFALSGVKIHVAIPDSRFVYDAAKHPGVDVINQ